MAINPTHKTIMKTTKKNLSPMNARARPKSTNTDPTMCLF